MSDTPVVSDTAADAPLRDPERRRTLIGVVHLLPMPGNPSPSQGLGAVLARADLRGAKLERANLTNANLVGAVFSEVNVSSRAGGGEWRTNLSHAKLCGAMLNGAVMRNADLEAVDFREADLRDVNFFGSLIMDADFTDADVRGANFNNTDTRGCKGLEKASDY